jgi:protein TonB
LAAESSRRGCSHAWTLRIQRSRANARLQGLVIVEATIARDGSVKDVRLLKSAHPLLDKAALDAVARWKYSPTTLNGDAVEVLLSVTVTFTLQ